MPLAARNFNLPLVLDGIARRCLMVQSTIPATARKTANVRKHNKRALAVTPTHLI
jgi:hypothetical protein